MNSPSPDHPSAPAVDVAIVGYGPTGALLANLLGQAGLSVLVFEREATIYELPRAVHFDGEVMRIFQSAGLAEQVAAVARASSKGMHFVNGSGQTLLIRRGAPGPGSQAWANNWYFHQPTLERVLRAGVKRFAKVQVKLFHEVFAIEQNDTHTILHVENQVDASQQQYRARYVVGCDGARSLVRQLIDPAVQDFGLHQPWLVVDLLTDRRSARVQSLPDYSIQWCDPARPMTLVYVAGERRRWEIMLLPGDDPAQLQRPEHFWPLLARWLRPNDAIIERAAVYTFHAVLAESWRDRRLLLAGDSCHQTPPFLGQGMGAGLRDAANLAWKLALVLQNRAAETLLDSYPAERRPHVQAFIELAVQLGQLIQTTDPAQAAARDQRFAAEHPQLFDFPQPALGPGLHSGAPPPVATLLPQPRLADGQLLDDVSGGRFTIIGNSALLQAVDSATRQRWRALEAVVIDQPGNTLDAWLEEQQAQALILRPDRYILGLAGTAAELIALSRLLPAVGCDPV
ncbi:MAG: bifunctional 3-(3-hydroxy-phenyl)propionate/3-hydroxycinnamic acid hydroxylase [Candidatus Competibacteraceae bacterium]|nr:bifunctional 3-(3-hydroxy-phenyl)propionate/3-hydroxycinnamic acid hydroxylase [Candidatus Competibacteraceae bacterium]